MPEILQSEALTQARIDIAALEVKVAGMEREIARLSTTVGDLVHSVNAMRDQLTEAKGGWKTLMLLGGASASFGGVLSWVADHLMRK